MFEWIFGFDLAIIESCFDETRQTGCGSRKAAFSCLLGDVNFSVVANNRRQNGTAKNVRRACTFLWYLLSVRHVPDCAIFTTKGMILPTKISLLSVCGSSVYSSGVLNPLCNIFISIDMMTFIDSKCSDFMVSTNCYVDAVVKNCQILSRTVVIMYGRAVSNSYLL